VIGLKIRLFKGFSTSILDPADTPMIIGQNRRFFSQMPLEFSV
jgi:hypothetical protein